MSKKISFFILAFVMITMLHISAGAEQNSDSEITSGVIFDDEEEQAYLEGLTDDEWEIIRQKEQKARELQNSPKPRATKISLPGFFSIYSQETDYYCIPACIKSALIYISDSYYTQTQIATDLGTDTSGTIVSRIAPYMNEKQDSNYYYNTRKDYLSVDDLRADVYLDIANYGIPVFLNVTSYATGTLVDHTIGNGHCMIIKSVYTDNSKFEIADPRGGGQYDVYFEAQTARVWDVMYSIVW